MEFRLFFNDKPSRIVGAESGTDLFIRQYLKKEYPSKIERVKKQEEEDHDVFGL